MIAENASCWACVACLEKQEQLKTGRKSLQTELTQEGYRSSSPTNGDCDSFLPYCCHSLDDMCLMCQKPVEGPTIAPFPGLQKYIESQYPPLPNGVCQLLKLIIDIKIKLISVEYKMVR